MKRFSPFLLLPLLVGCGGLSEAELRAAKAHADNICLIASAPKDAQLFNPEFIAGLSDMAEVAGAKNDKESRFVIEGTRMARERGCVK